MDSGTRVGKYAVGRKLGQGGFGVLYVARDSELDREVAIKFLRPEHAFKSHVVQRFLQEARAAARISHPGIVTVFECGVVAGTHTRADGTVYIAMELLTGETLAARIRREKLPLGIAIGMARQLADGLAAAHDAQIVHRDLKPSNIFLIPDTAIPGGERIKILDFGIAKLVDGWGASIQTHSMEMLGTPMYMSPEQCKSSARVDARSDIYALGCMLFELVCGRPPFEGDAGELIAKHQLVAPPLASELSPSVPPGLDALIARMLAKSPDDRPQSMADVVGELDRVATEPARHVSVLDPGPATRSDELATTIASQQRRPSRALWLGAGAAIALGITIVLATTRGDGSAAIVAVQQDAAVAVVIAAPPVDAAPILADAPPPDAPGVEETRSACDQLVDSGTAEVSRGNHRAALSLFDRALKCKDDPHTLGLAFMAACNSKTLPYAKRYWRALSADAQSRFIQICLHNRITAEMLNDKPAPPPPRDKCDADALVSAGTADVAHGAHDLALAKFDAALRCQPDSHTLVLAFMSACNASNIDSARKYWQQMVPDARTRYIQICVHNHITEATLDR